PEHLHPRAEAAAQFRDYRRALQPAAARGCRNHVAPAIDYIDMAGVAGNNTVLADGRFADASRGKDGLPTTDEHARSTAVRPARTQLERCVLGHQLSPRVIVGSAEQGGHRHVDKIRVAVPGFTIGEGELGAFDDDMDEIGPERIE